MSIIDPVVYVRKWGSGMTRSFSKQSLHYNQSYLTLEANFSYVLEPLKRTSNSWTRRGWLTIKCTFKLGSPWKWAWYHFPLNPSPPFLPDLMVITAHRLECVSMTFNHCEDFKYISVLAHHCLLFFLILGSSKHSIDSISQLPPMGSDSIFFFLISLVKYSIFNNLSGLG